MPKKKKYIEIDFYKLWKHIRIGRQSKETIKTTLFTRAPVLFKRFASYHHWENSRVFQRKADAAKENPNEQPTKSNTFVAQKQKLAIVLHAFYFDVFKEILLQLPNDEGVKFKLFISCPKELHKKIFSAIQECNFEVEITDTENHGRDILPFLKILPIVFEQNYNLVFKIHTKRSNHLNKKDLWGSDLFEKLLNEDSITKVVDVFSAKPNVGMLGPAGHILPMAFYYGGNSERVLELCLRMGLKSYQLSGLNFVAGSMFFARKEVLEPILNLGLSDSDFESENNQLDNTMAHAVERAFAAGLIITSMQLADTSSTKDNITCTLTINHPFTI